MSLKKENIQDILILTLGMAIASAAVYFVLLPSHVSVGSVSGLALVLSNFIPLPVSAITLVLNVGLLLIGFIFIGREFGAKSVYTSLLLPAFLWIFERVFPNVESLTGDQLLDTICFVLIIGAGQAILFSRNASSGGLDIAAKLLNKYLHMDLGKAVGAVGMCAALSSALVYDKRTVVLSVLGTYLSGIVLDHFIFGMNVKRRVCIISPKLEEIRTFILGELHSGATIYEARGAYANAPHEEIITIVDKNEYSRLMAFLKKADPTAFITVYTVSEVSYQPKAR